MTADSGSGSQQRAFGSGEFSLKVASSTRAKSHSPQICRTDKSRRVDPGGEIRATQASQLGFVLSNPCNVIAAIAPWNFSRTTVPWKVRAALAAGHAVVLKSSEWRGFHPSVLSNSRSERGWVLRGHRVEGALGGRSRIRGSDLRVGADHSVPFQRKIRVPSSPHILAMGWQPVSARAICHGALRTKRDMRADTVWIDCNGRTYGFAILAGGCKGSGVW